MFERVFRVQLAATVVQAVQHNITVGGNSTANASLIFNPQEVHAQAGDVVTFVCESQLCLYHEATFSAFRHGLPSVSHASAGLLRADARFPPSMVMLSTRRYRQHPPPCVFSRHLRHYVLHAHAPPAPLCTSKGAFCARECISPNRHARQCAAHIPSTYSSDRRRLPAGCRLPFLRSVSRQSLRQRIQFDMMKYFCVERTTLQLQLSVYCNIIYLISFQYPPVL